MDILGEIKQAIIAGQPRYVETLVEQAMEQRISAETIMNDAMLPGMRDAGELFRNRETDIARVLTAARCMRLGMERLEPHLLDKGNRPLLGKAILGTVEGDLHDMGKNMVAIMFRCAGFEVIDLGVDVSERQFIEAVRRNPDASIVCISSLLTTTLEELRNIVTALREAKNLPPVQIMVGGGSVTQEFADTIGADAYTETAVDAAECAKRLILARRKET